MPRGVRARATDRRNGNCACPGRLNTFSSAIQIKEGDMSLTTRLDKLEAALRGREPPDEPWICRRLIYDPLEWVSEKDEAIPLQSDLDLVTGACIDLADPSLGGARGCGPAGCCRRGRSRGCFRSHLGDRRSGLGRGLRGGLCGGDRCSRAGRRIGCGGPGGKGHPARRLRSRCGWEARECKKHGHGPPGAAGTR